MEAINENYVDLEAGEENDALVARLKPGVDKVYRQTLSAVEL
jgi:hypothetical protein